MMLTVTGSSLKQRMWGMVLSYLDVTTTRISHNVFVSFDSWGKEWYYFMGLVPELVHHAINYSWNKGNVY